MSVAYRLSDEAPFPAALEDAKCAVCWVRANADEFGVDPQRIAIAGSSAGAHLAAMICSYVVVRPTHMYLRHNLSAYDAFAQLHDAPLAT